jgi:hypothetical protein
MPVGGGSQRLKLMVKRAPNVPDEEGDDNEEHRLGPWMETPNSTRVSRLRYDFAQQAVQVQWRNGKNNGYVYEGVDYETYRSFARVVSKGRYINSTLNGYGYREMDADESTIPSDPRYSVVSRYRE